jgi:hypothetical protein
VSDYGLIDRGRSPAGAKDFCSALCVQTVFGPTQRSYPVGTSGPFSGGKARPELDADQSLPSVAVVKNE